MRTGLRLSHKGILLIAVPLAFELVFILVLYQLMQKSELEAARASHYKAVTSETNKIVTGIYEGMSTLVTYHLSNTADISKHYTDVIAEIPQRLAVLKELVADDAYQTKTLKELEPDVQVVLRFMTMIKKNMDEGNALMAVVSISRWDNAIRQPFMRLMTRLHELVSYQNTSLNFDPAEEARLRDLFKIILAGGILGNMILAAFVWKLTTNITRRVEVLTENTFLLSDRKKLIPVQKGNDEISRLDLFFHHMAAALNEAYDKEKAIVQSMQVGLSIVDKDGKVISINPRMERLFHYSESELAGKNITVLFGESGNADEDVSFAQNLLENSLNKICETTAITKTGESVPVEVMTSNLGSQKNRMYIVNFLDVSERHEVERLKREFVAMVSHDLRTPLTSVLSSLTLLGTGTFGDLNAKGTKLVETSETELTRLIQLINDLLDVARMEAGRMEFHFAEVDIDSVIESSINAVRGVAQKANIALKVPTTNCRIVADGDRLIQVLVNLLSNAIKFSPEKSEVEILVNTTPHWTEIAVKDHGSGIPRSSQERIFDRFQQVERSDNKHKSGTGLGLAICKTIVDGHNGSIGVTSEENCGSTFWFRVPNVQGS